MLNSSMDRLFTEWRQLLDASGFRSDKESEAASNKMIEIERRIVAMPCNSAAELFCKAKIAAFQHDQGAPTEEETGEPAASADALGSLVHDLARLAVAAGKRRKTHV